MGIRNSVHFFRPKTKTLKRAPKAVSKVNSLDKFRIVVAPITTESAMKKIEEINTLVFLCDIRANKSQIKEAVQSLYQVKVSSVKTLIRPDNQKKAYVKLEGADAALDVANK